MIHLEPAKEQDFAMIMSIIEDAKQLRKAQGSTQWQDGYPNEQTIRNDYLHHNAYVLTDGKNLLAYCAIIFNDEPAYEQIEGKWLNEDPFFVIHRVAITKKELGKGYGNLIFKLIEDFCKEREVYNIKVDTHFDNQAMLSILEKLGYVYCGEVYFRGSPRRAFQKVLTT